jgi:hypothetical protein
MVPGLIAGWGMGNFFSELKRRQLIQDIWRKAMRQLLSVFTSALLVLSLPAAAQDYKVVGQFGWFGVGKATEMEKDHVLWVGEFSGTFFNDKGANSLFDRSPVRCPGSYDLNFGKKEGHASGYCIIMGEGSDQAFAKWSCDGDTVDCSGTFEYTGGTGRYQSATGNNTFRARTVTNWKDGNVSGFATWNR